MPLETDRTNIFTLVGDIYYRDGFIYGFYTGILVSTVTFIILHSRCTR